MAEYIKREAVLRSVQGQRSPCRSPAQNRMLDCLKAAIIRISTADVAPVVRCKNCKHRVYKYMNEEIGKIGGCGLFNRAMSNDDFCSYGERKDGGDG